MRSVLTSLRPWGLVLAGLSLLGGTTACRGDDAPAPDRPQPVSVIDDLSDGDATTIALDDDLRTRLRDAGAKAGAYGTAELVDGVYELPITGGHVTIFEPDAVDRAVVGQVQHEGSGLTFTARGTTVTVGNFNLDPGVGLVYGDVVVGREVEATSTPVLRLDVATMTTPSFDEGVAVLDGATVALTDTTAELLDQAFGTDSFDGDTAVGVATVTAVLPAE